MSNLKTFCVAPWVHLNVRVSGKLAPCCVSTLVSDCSYDHYQEWWNGDKMAALRKDLVNGIRPASCNYCWASEELGRDSMRQNYNSLFNSYIDINSIKQSKVDNNFINVSDVSTWQLDIGNLCNIKCIMCNPTLSDKIKEEVLQNPSNFKNFPVLINQAHLQIQKNWINTKSGKDFLNQIAPSLRWVKIQGGEALSVKELRDFLDNIADSQVTISIITNGTILDRRIVEIFKKFKKVDIAISLEAASVANDIIRYGSSWETILKTIDTLTTLDQVDLQFNHVVQASSVLFMPEVIKFAEARGVHLAMLPLQSPAYLSLNVCSPELLNRLQQQIEKLTIKHPKNKSIKSYITNAILKAKYNEELHQKFLEYVNALDSIRDNKLAPLLRELL